jgi:Putative transposase
LNPQILNPAKHKPSDFRPWSQKLELHPHVHCVVPAGGLCVDRTRWIKPRYDFFLSVGVLGSVFRGKFYDALQRAFHDGKLNFHGSLKRLAQPKIFAAWLRPLFRKDWVVYAKRPKGDKLLSLSLDEFLRRFLLHVLPKGFVRIRHFGFLANRRRATTLPLCLHLLGSTPHASPEITAANSSDAWLCPRCGGAMLVIEKFTATEIQLRSPPTRGAVAA